MAAVPVRRSDGLAWRNLLSGIGAGEGGVGHGEVGWVERLFSGHPDTSRSFFFSLQRLLILCFSPPPTQSASLYPRCFPGHLLCNAHRASGS